MDDELKEISNLLLDDPEKGNRLFFERYGGTIKKAVSKAYFKYSKKNVMDMEDLLQDTLCYILKKMKKIIDDFKGKGNCKFMTYLFVICLRYAIREVQDEWSHKFPLGEKDPNEIPDFLCIETEVSNEEQIKALEQAIEQLNEDEKIFIKMMFYDNRSTSVIMIFFGWKSPNTVYSKKHKIIAKLKKIIRKILKKDYSDE